MKTYKPTLKNAFGERRGKNLLGKIYMAIFFSYFRQNECSFCVCVCMRKEGERKGRSNKTGLGILKEDLDD